MTLSAWHKSQHKMGLCVFCTRPLKHYKWRCDYHQVLQRQQERKRTGGKRWKKGGRGRPPNAHRDV